MPASFGLRSDLNKIYSYEWEWCKGISDRPMKENKCWGNFGIFFSIISDIYIYFIKNICIKYRLSGICNFI